MSGIPCGLCGLIELQANNPEMLSDVSEYVVNSPYTIPVAFGVIWLIAMTYIVMAITMSGFSKIVSIESDDVSNNQCNDEKK